MNTNETNLEPSPEMDRIANELGRNCDGSYKEQIEPHAFWTMVEHAKSLEVQLNIEKEESAYWRAAYTEQVLSS